MNESILILVQHLFQLKIYYKYKMPKKPKIEKNCEHGKVKYTCNFCNPCSHGKLKQNCNICTWV